MFPSRCTIASQKRVLRNFPFKTALSSENIQRGEQKRFAIFTASMLEVELMPASCGTKKCSCAINSFQVFFEFHFEDRKTRFCYTFLSYFFFASCFSLLNLDAICMKIIRDRGGAILGHIMRLLTSSTFHFSQFSNGFTCT